MMVHIYHCILDAYKKQIGSHEHDTWRENFYRQQGLKPNTGSLAIDEFILNHKTLEHKKPKDILIYPSFRNHALWSRTCNAELLLY